MKESPLKSFLLSGYFSLLELRLAVTGALGYPPCQLVHIDYDEYWRQRKLSGVEPRFSLIAGQIEAHSTVLDVGCGDGAFLAWLKETKQARAVGLDISEVAVEKARGRGVDARVQLFDEFCHQQQPGAFDYVVISEVLEHVPNPEAFVRAGARLARRALFLTFPNIAYFRHRLRLLLGKFPVQWVVFPGEHLRFWSLPDFREWLACLGFSSPHMAASNGLILFNLHRAWPNLFGNQIVVRLEPPHPDHAN